MDTQQRNIKEKWVTFYILKFATHVKTSKRKKKKKSKYSKPTNYKKKKMWLQAKRCTRKILSKE